MNNLFDRTLDNWKYTTVRRVLKVTDDITKMILTKARLNATKQMRCTFRLDTLENQKMFYDFARIHFKGEFTKFNARGSNIRYGVFKVPYTKQRALIMAEYVTPMKVRVTCKLSKY